MSATSRPPGQVLMTRRERREAEAREREAALRATGRSGDTVVVGGITFPGPAPVSPALGNPVVEPARRVVQPRHGAVAGGPTPPASAPRPSRPDVPARLPALSRPDAHAGRPSPSGPDAPAARPSPRRAERVAPAAPAAPRLFPATAVPAPVAPSAPAPWHTAVSPFPEPRPAAVVPAREVPIAARPAEPRPAVPRPAVRTRAERAGRTRSALPEQPCERKRGAWLPRVAVLGTLAAATIAAPLTPLSSTLSADARSPFDLDIAPTGPSTLDVVRDPVVASATAPGIAAPPAVARATSGASRSLERDPLPGCDGAVTVTSTNGHLTDGELCDLPFAPGMRLQPRAAVALTALNEAFRAQFGTDIGLVDSYRSLGRQYSVKGSRGYLAAQPGTSMHGLGLAIDLSSAVTGSSAAYRWLVENGAAYGWENPAWARRGGSGNYEPWHFEFRPGVEELSAG
ncbi:M15 family metallopeptidase [Xylanimonas ulmi]|nr:M15 family metallopeptidase [Xylanibacterium ulmi]